MENNFEVKKDGSTLNVLLDDELSVANSPALTEELSKYRNQGIEKVVFDVTGLIYISSSGIRCIFYAFQELGQQPEIVFVNCAKEIYEVLDHVGMIPSCSHIFNPFPYYSTISYRHPQCPATSCRVIYPQGKSRKKPNNGGRILIAFQQAMM